MSNQIQVQPKKPKLSEIIKNPDIAVIRDNFNLIVNMKPQQHWIKQHPMVNIKINGTNQPMPYLPVRKVKQLLRMVYGTFEWEVKECKQILNAIVVVGRITVTNPVTGLREFQEGVGAASIQMDKGAQQGDLTAIKANAIQIGAPSAESYAFKNAAEKFGDLFGGNLYDTDNTAYAPVFSDELRTAAMATLEDITQLFDAKKSKLTPEQLRNAERIINEEEKASYPKLYKQLQSL